MRSKISAANLNMKMPRFIPFLLCAAMAGGVVAQTPSKLWGIDGSQWNAQSRLPDFSFAGYGCGERPIPKVQVAGNVKEFGAIGDGIADDTEAFRKALESIKSGAILVPAGRYVLTGQIQIAKSGVVLRGEGMGKTVLVFPKSLEQIHSPRSIDGGKSRWSFSGAFVEFNGTQRGRKLAELAQPARRGDCQLELRQSPGIAPGAWVRLLMNNDPALGRQLHGDLLDAADETRKEYPNLCDFVARVKSVSGTRIVLDHPLRTDARPEWKAELQTWEPGLEESGIESLSFEFSGVAKKAHLQEEGFNAIQMNKAANCWVRDVEVIDADIGVIVARSRFCTVEGFKARAAKRSSAETGHHALWATAQSQDCLFTGFNLETEYVHDLSVEGCAAGNVFERGKGVAIDFDHHCNAPYENLFTEIQVGNPRRIWHCGGRADRGPQSAARTTFWNLQFNPTAKLPGIPAWPQLNLIGFPGELSPLTHKDQWIEPCPGGVTPPNLFQAQLQLRLQLPPGTAAKAAEGLDSARIQSRMLSAFDWQIRNLITDKSPIDDGGGLRGWVHGAFLTGVLKAYRVTKEPAYLEYAWKSAGQCGWQIGPKSTHADDLICAQTYAELYRIDKTRANLQPTLSAFDQLLSQRHNGAKLLSWCDSLYMLPPALARLSTVTGDPKYLAEMKRLYFQSKELLFDPEERLFFRDKTFMPHDPHFQPTRVFRDGRTEAYQEKNGKKMFWSRGNAWVFAGLANILDEMPKNDPDRSRFEDLFKILARRLVELQPADGMWRMGLLDQDAYGHGEASGTAFFVYGLAWGVRNGLLNPAEYRPAIEKGWHGLVECQRPDGMLGYVQGVGSAPGTVSPTSYQEYGTGAYLLAGAELLELSLSLRGLPGH